MVRVSQVDGHRAPPGICAPAKLRPTFLDSVRRFTRRCFQLMAHPKAALNFGNPFWAAHDAAARDSVP